MHLTTFLVQLMIFNATRIRASTLLAELTTVRIEHGNKLFDFTHLYPKFSPHLPAIYKHNEQIYELWAQPSTGQHLSLVTKFSLSQIPFMTPDSIVLKGVWIAKSIVLHCKLSLENAQKIYQDYRPVTVQHTPLYRPSKLWKILGLHRSNQTTLDLLQVTRKSLAMFIDPQIPANVTLQYAIRSLEDGKPYVAFDTYHFGVIAYRGRRIVKAIVVIAEFEGTDELHHYYGLEFDNVQNDGIMQAMSNATQYRPDLVTDTARMYLSAWLSDSDELDGS